jgi:hypothetical protein
VDPDTVPPTLTVPADITVPATSIEGASVAFNVTATDDHDSNPAVSCSPASGGLFPVGDTTVTCMATDQAGNTTTDSFKIHVSGAADQLSALVSAVRTTNGTQGIVNSLDAKLTAVQQALTAANAGNRGDATNKLGAFINDVSAQSGKALTPDQAAQLINAAKQIQAALG